MGLMDCLFNSVVFIASIYLTDMVSILYPHNDNGDNRHGLTVTNRILWTDILNA